MLSKGKRIGVALMSVLISPLVMVGAAGTSAAHAPCGRTAPDLDDSSWVYTANSNHMRTGSLDTCGSNGIAYSSHQLDYHCWTSASNGQGWTYARNNTTGATGWIKNLYLDDYGSAVHCGF